MGWSCNAAASLTLNAIGAYFNLCANKAGIREYQNVMVAEGKEYGFWETSRVEHNDGAITGSIFRYTTPEQTHVRKAGSFRIEGNGQITRFPCLTKRERDICERDGATEFRRRYGNMQADHENVSKVA